ncbi:hypothetical protein ES702_07253 [subsurface metagenome]
MSIPFTGIKGLAFYDSRRAYNGFTLFTPVNGRGAWLIDMRGGYVHRWEMGYEPGCYGELLPNGNLLYAGKVADGPLSDLEGAGGVLLEVDWDGNVVWEYRDPYLHHAFHRMKNGNTLVLRWVKVPGEIAAKVKGGDPGTEREGVMWGDAIQEITPDGKVAWEWISYEHLDLEVDVTCPICPRSTWTHANACVELPDGNILTSFMKNNTIAVIDKETGSIKWRWGPGDLAHQHSPSVLDNGNILVFDNGLHPDGFARGMSRVLEVNPSTSRVVWSYEGGKELLASFYSSAMSSCQRLPNGNTFICEGTSGRLFEVTANGGLVWEYVTGLLSCEPFNTRTCMVYSAYRYGTDYSGLKRPLPVPVESQSAPGISAAEEEEEAQRFRLKKLGY